MFAAADRIKLKQLFMKRFLTIISFAVMVSVTLPLQSFATDPKIVATENPVPKDVDARSAQLLDRLQQIKSMDKETLTRAEKKELRKEVKEIKKEMKAAGNGIYLSVG